jgi:hypothetical protein
MCAGSHTQGFGEGSRTRVEPNRLRWQEGGKGIQLTGCGGGLQCCAPIFQPRLRSDQNERSFLWSTVNEILQGSAGGIRVD